MSNKKTNIILIIMDSGRKDMFGCYGSAENLTPNIDLLAKRGLILRNHYAAGSGSAQAHVSIFTGQHSARHKMPHNLCQLRDDILPVSLLLKKLDYKVFGHTKFSVVPPAGYGDLFGFDELIYPEKEKGADQTISIWNKISRSLKSYPRLWSFLKKLYDRFGSNDFKLRVQAEHFDGKSSLDYLFNKLKENRDKSAIFAYTTLLHPHTPYYPPREFLNKIFKGKKIHKVSYSIQFDPHAYVNGNFGEAKEAMESVRKCYKADLLYGDYLIGKFIEKLEAESLMENTIFIIVADHGEMLGEHREINHGGGVWEELFNTPCIIYYPEKIRPGSSINHLTSGLDIVPTIFDLIGMKEWAKNETVLDGVSVFEQDYDWKRRYLVVDSPPYVLPGRFKRYPNVLKKAHIISRALRTLSYKYIWRSNGNNCLFRTGQVEHPENNLILKRKDLADKFYDGMVRFYTSVEPNFKMDEYPLPYSKKVAEKMTDPYIRDELIKLGYLTR